MFLKIVFSLLLISPFAAMAMDEQNMLAIGSTPSLAAEISIDSTPEYIGESDQRDRFEKIYGKNFPLNTIFFCIRFAGPEIYRRGDVPTRIAYDDIKDKDDGDTVELTMNGHLYTVYCRHKGRTPYCGQMTFHELVARQMQSFKKRADWSCMQDGEASLIEAKVIDLENYETYGNNGTLRLCGHGQNCSPHVK